VNSRSVHKLLGALTTELDIPKAAFTVVFVTDSAMRGYNRRYRGFDKTTDVLSFRGENDYLGDILISTETAYNQARKSRTLNFESNIRRLLLHGLLHLMGHDHETDQGEMRAIERRLRRRFHC
jgi:probable rRNA maturation factor